MTGSDTIDAAVRAAEPRRLTGSTLADNWLPARLDALLAMDTRLCHVHIGICRICDHVMCTSRSAFAMRDFPASVKIKDNPDFSIYLARGIDLEGNHFSDPDAPVATAQ